MLFQQSTLVVAGWIGPTIAISLVIIAGAFGAIAFAIVRLAQGMQEETRKLHTAIESLRAEFSPALGAIQSLSGETGRLATIIGNEAEELVKASQSLRHGLEERLHNLEAIYEVLEEEVEETVIDVAVTLRTFRTGRGWFARIRRLLLGRGRHD
jgi:methyl-accepting chemotaxis protein